MSTPTTVEVSGTTYTSGYAYLSYDGVTAFGCGNSKPGGVLSIPSSEVFSYRGHAAAMPQVGDVHWPFNFADLAPNPVPWDAWISQETCAGLEFYPNCQTITQAAYRPWLVYPSAFWSLDPKWSSCISGAFGVMDPPSALPELGVMAIPTTPGAMSTPTRSAAPKMDPTKSLLKPTAAPWSTQTTVHPGKESASSMDLGAEHATRMGVNTETYVATTVHIPTSVIRSSAMSVGTIRISRASQDGAVSVGSHVLSAGEATTIGNTVMSLGSKTLVIGVRPKPSDADAGGDSDRALSILASAQTQKDPRATFTLEGHTYTAYSGGLVAEVGMTVALPNAAATTVDGHIMSLGNNGVVVDATSFDFQRPPPKSTSGAPNPSISIVQHADELIAAIYTHGASKITVFGHVDPAGTTIMTYNSSAFTYAGQPVVGNGTTFNPVLSDVSGKSGQPSTSTTMEDPARKTGLPSIVSVNQSTSSALTLPPSTSTSRRRAASTAQTTSSSSAASTNLSGATLPPVVLTAYLVFLLLTTT